MFAKFTHWTWVIIAWAQLALTYVGYLLYLRWLERRAANGNEDSSR